MSDAELRVGGTKLDTWTEVTVSASMVDMVPTFSFGFVDTHPLEPLPIGKGYPCEVYLGGHLAITGHIDRVRHRNSRSGGVSSYEVTGRGKTADLADCSVRHKTGRLKKSGLLTIANELCKPYAIKVQLGDGMAPDSLARLSAQVTKQWEKFKLRLGDTVHGTLAKAAKERGCVLMESTDGKLVVTRSGSLQIQTALVYGKNVEEWERDDDITSQYSEYEILGQRWSSNTWNGEKARGARGVIDDESAMRFRPLTMMAERSVSNADLEARAKYERNLRQGLSEQIRVTVPGWTYTEPRAALDTLWRPNRLVRARNEEQGIDGSYIVVDCTYTKTRDGSRTVMSLAPPEAFEPFEPPKKKKPKKRGRGLTNAQRLVILEDTWRNAYITVALKLAQSGASKVTWFDKYKKDAGL